MFSASDLGFRDQDEKRKFLRDIVISFILAGKDSTSTALTWFFWLIAGHPQCEQLIYNELSAAATSSPLNSPKIFSYEELKKLPLVTRIYIRIPSTISTRTYKFPIISSRKYFTRWDPRRKRLVCGLLSLRDGEDRENVAPGLQRVQAREIVGSRRAFSAVGSV